MDVTHHTTKYNDHIIVVSEDEFSLLIEGLSIIISEFEGVNGWKERITQAKELKEILDS